MLSIKLRKLIPEGALKSKIRCYYYNHIVKTDFNASYKNGCFQFKFKNGITIKCYETIWRNTAISLEGYVRSYKLKKGDVVIDCGAYRGEFALYAAKAVGDTGIIVAFEPDSINYKKLTDNLKLNNLSNIITVNKGIWSENTILKFSNEHLGVSSFLVDDNTKSTIDVAVVSLDNELEERGIKKVDFIKMDIEGAEIEAVKGAKKILKNNDINLAIASYHIVKGEKTCFELEKLFSKLGYKAETSFPEHLTTYASKNKITFNDGS